MTQLMGRPLECQSQGVQLFTIAVRRWVKAAVDGKCVCHVIGAAFRTAGLDAASAPFHAAMQTLCQNARVTLRFGTADRPGLSEHEAKLVEGLIAAEEERFHDLRAITHELVFPDLAPALAKSLGAVAKAFKQSTPFK